jgi:hypothetical protein
VAAAELLRHELTGRGQIAVQAAEIIVIRVVMSAHQTSSLAMAGRFMEVETRAVWDFFPRARRV